MDHKTILHEGLRRQREALLAKLDGLPEHELRRPRTPTGTNLLGLLKHAAAVELGYFGEVFGRPSDLPSGMSEDDPNADLYASADESPEDVLAYARACFAHADATIGALDADAEGRVPWWPPEKATVTLAQVLAHVALDEARHAGHADILRELTDGQAGLRGPGNNLPDWDAARWAEHVRKLEGIAASTAAPAPTGAASRPSPRFMDLEQLLELEHDGWDALCRGTGADFYGTLMTDDAVMVLVNGAVLDRDAVRASLDGAPAWDAYTITAERLVPAGDGAATLVYRATARRGDAPPFEALMSSTYALVDGAPRLTVYQQTTVTH